MAYSFRTWSCVIGFGAAVACATGEDLAFEGSSPANGGRSAAAGGANGGSLGSTGASAGRAGEKSGGGMTGAAGDSSGMGEGELGSGGAASLPEEEACSAAAEAGKGGASGLSVELKANSAEPASFPRGELIVSNESASAVALADLELRYYVESEYSDTLTAGLRVLIDYAEVRGALTYRSLAEVQGRMVLVRSAVAGANAFAQITFPASLDELAAYEHVLVQFRVAAPDGDATYYSVSVDQTNDFSFGACAMHAAPWDRVAVFDSGKLISGQSPIDEGIEAGAGGSGGQGAAGASGMGGAWQAGGGQGGASGGAGTDAL